MWDAKESEPGVMLLFVVYCLSIITFSFLDSLSVILEGPFFTISSN